MVRKMRSEVDVMAIKKDRGMVLAMVSEGTVTPDEAEQLLAAMDERGAGRERVVLEMDADRDNLRQVMGVLKRVFGS